MFIDGSICAFGCGVGKFGNSLTGYCDDCSIGCMVCSSKTTCSACYSSYKVVNNKCDCVTGIMLSDGTCYLNPDPCNGKPYMYSTDGSCTSTCAIGFYLDSPNNMCRPCNTGCSSCTDFTACGSYTVFFTHLLM